MLFEIRLLQVFFGLLLSLSLFSCSKKKEDVKSTGSTSGEKTEETKGDTLSSEGDVKVETLNDALNKYSASKFVKESTLKVVSSEKAVYGDIETIEEDGVITIKEKYLYTDKTTQLIIDYDEDMADIKNVGVRIGEEGSIAFTPVFPDDSDTDVSVSLSFYGDVCSSLGSGCFSFNVYSFLELDNGTTVKMKPRRMVVLCGSCSHESCKSILYDNPCENGKIIDVGSGCSSTASSYSGTICVSHNVTYITNSKEYRINPVTVNTIRAGLSMKPFQKVGKSTNLLSESCYQNASPGYYDYSSSDNWGCTSNGRLLIPGYYIVENDIKIDNNFTRLNISPTDFRQLRGHEWWEIGESFSASDNRDEEWTNRPYIKIKNTGSSFEVKNFETGQEEVFFSDDVNIAVEYFVPHNDLSHIRFSTDEIDRFSSLDGKTQGSMQYNLKRSTGFEDEDYVFDLTINFKGVIVYIDNLLRLDQSRYISDTYGKQYFVLNGSMRIVWVGNNMPALVE